jgi:transcription elongation GreA/GreB family factor
MLSSEVVTMSVGRMPPGIREAIEARLEELRSRLPRLEAEAVETDEVETHSLLAAVRGEISDIEQMLRAGSGPAGGWDPRRIEVHDIVTLEDRPSGLRERYTLVPAPVLCRADETWVSDLSPLGSSLIGRRTGEEIEVRAPGGTIRYRIVGFSRAP